MFPNKILGLWLCLMIPLNEALRFLVVFPLASKSHAILGHGVSKHLTDAGHDVVLITSYPKDKPVPRLKEINVGIIAESVRNGPGGDDFKLKNMIGKPNMGDSFLFLYFIYDFNKQVLEHEDVQKLLSDPNEKFDAVILEWLFSEAMVGIPPLFHCPLIWFGTTEAHWNIIRLIDEIPNPAYTLDLFSTSSLPLNFWERLSELWSIVKKYTVIKLIVQPFDSWLHERVFKKLAEQRGIEMPGYYEALNNGSLLLLNSHPSFGTPYTLPQNVKHIAGYHIDTDVKPLPKNLQKVMDDAKYGVIYFSMGSHLESKDMSDGMKQSILKLFRNLKQTVLWKFEGDLLNVPSNVVLLKWAPQQSILSHRNIKFFITHGGQLSTTEAIHFGVPVIGLPVMADQHLNMKLVTNQGFGINVKLAEDMADELTSAVEEMLKNDSYSKRAKEISSIYHDRLIPPGKELVHWVEHVVRTRGALHLRSPALMVPWYQKMYLDLVALILAIIFAIKLLLKRLRRRSKQNVDTGKKNK